MSQLSHELYGRIAQIPEDSEGRQRQRVLAVKRAEVIEQHRLLHKEIRALGICYLDWDMEQAMLQNQQQFPMIPTIRGIDRRIQESADGRYFHPAPFVHVRKKMQDIDPRNARSAYGGTTRPQSCYLLNPDWYKVQGIWSWYEITQEFAYMVMKVDSMEGLRSRLR